jgi:hypothetical protein
MVAGMMFEVGGLQFPAAPFAGWYTSVEIATRDLLEPTRYNLMKVVNVPNLFIKTALLSNLLFLTNFDGLTTFFRISALPSAMTRATTRRCGRTGWRWR